MDKRLYWLALGTFAIGVESFAISSLLPMIASSTGVTVAQAGYLVIAYALANALGSPILAAVTGAMDRRRILTAAAVMFSAAAVWASMSRGYFDLMAARVLMAFCAGLYTATAQATGVAISSVDHRARAIAVIVGGTTLAVAFGAPLGALIGGVAGWRGTYLVVALFGIIAAGSIWVLLPANLRGTSVSLRHRVEAALLPGVPTALLVTWLHMTGAFTVIIYIAVLSTGVMGLTASAIPGVLLAFGIGAAVGVFTGGQLADRFGPRQIIVGALGLSSVLLASLSLLPELTESLRIGLFFAVMVGWGFIGWGFVPAQSSRLLSFAPNGAQLVLSLNASALFLGVAAGSFVGGLVIAQGATGQLGFVGAIFPLTALGVLAASRVRPPKVVMTRLG